MIKRVGNIWNPGKVSVVQDGHDTKYIVKCCQAMSYLWLVKIYNKAWNLISTININPDALTVTPGGNLLLVYDNRIYEYNQDGTFIKGLLDKYKFNGIELITYVGGCLWALERFPYSFKIFVAN